MRPLGVSQLMNVRAQHWRGVEGIAGEDRREILCGLRRWQVQRCVCVCLCVYMHVCVGGCVGAEESTGLRLKEGEVILSGKAERRMERDMAGDSCKWEEQYGGRWLEDTARRQPANVKAASDGVLLIMWNVCLCESVCIPC